jgi:probable HAF family extracellular repeat protein
LSVSSLAQAPLQYTAVDLGTLGGPSSFASGINNHGDVVGTSNSNPFSASQHGFLYSGGIMTEFVPFSAIPQLAASFNSDFSGINDLGDAVGSSDVLLYHSETNSYTREHHAFLYSASTGLFTDLGTLGGGFSSASAINDVGQIVGTARTSDGGTYAFLYQNGVMTNLGTAGGPGSTGSTASGISENGFVVGSAATSDTTSPAFRYSMAEGMVSLPTLDYVNANGIHLPAPSSYGYGVNDVGAVVGVSDTSPFLDNLPSAFLYENGTLQRIGFIVNENGNTTYQSAAWDINNSGTVVGSAFFYNAAGRAFVRLSGVDYNVNELVVDSTVEFTDAHAINDLGQIAATGTLPTGESHAFLLNPVAGNPTPTPTPPPTPTPTPTNTSVGTTVTVNAQAGAAAISLTFSQVTVAGTTTVSLIDENSTGTLPPGYELIGSGLAFDISTTASYTPPIIIAFQIPPVDPTTFSQLRVLHNEGGVLVDRTASDPVPYTTTQTIYASVDSLSPFVIAKRRYNFTGFFQPVDNGITNLAKAGQTIPIKWRLTDATGAPISDPSSFVSVTSFATPGGCGGSADAIETYSGAAASGVQYLGDGNWQYNWKTPKSYAGQCRTLSLNLKDGASTRTAFFTFK